MKSWFSRLWKCRMSETISQDFTRFLRPWRFLVLREWFFIPYQVYHLSIKHLPRYNTSFPNSLRRTSMWPCLETKSSGMWQQQRRTRPSRQFVCWLLMMIPLILIALTCMDIDDLFPGCTKGTCFGHGTSPVVLEDSNQEVLVELGWCWSTRMISQQFLWSLKTALRKCSISVDKNQRMPIVDLYFEAHPTFTSLGYGMQIWPFRSTRRQFTTHSTAMKDFRP